MEDTNKTHSRMSLEDRPPCCCINPKRGPEDLIFNLTSPPSCKKCGGYVDRFKGPEDRQVNITGELDLSSLDASKDYLYLDKEPMPKRIRLSNGVEYRIFERDGQIEIHKLSSTDIANMSIHITPLSGNSILVR